MERLLELTELILDSRNLAYMLRPEILEIKEILAASGTYSARPGEDIASGETRTSHGLAVSPTMAIMCADDYMRTIQYLRGTHAAILDLRARIPDRPVRVLYAGCGPCATLASPLMAVLPASEVAFTLLDLHSESIESARSVVETLGFGGHVKAYETLDVMEYHIDPDEPPDLVVSEVMQVCLGVEPQVAVTRHLLAQAPQAVIVPEEVRIELSMADPAREFDIAPAEDGEFEAKRDRITVGTAFALNRETVASWGNDNAHRIPAATLEIPAKLEQRYLPMLLTVIQVYGDHELRDYDSGLTIPKPLSVAAGPGDRIHFCYEMGATPGLEGTVDL
jgi:hypothetical protein